MDEQKLEQSLTKLLQEQEKFNQRIAKLEESQASLTQSLSESSANEEVEQLKEEILELRQSIPERFVSAFEQADLDPEKDPIAQRIFEAIEAKGFDIVLQEAEEEETEVEKPEPEPTIVEGKKDGDGWRFLENIGMSIKEG